MTSLLKHPLTSLIFGLLIGIIATIYFGKTNPPIQKFDPSPWEDSIKVLKQEKIDYRTQGDFSLQRAEATIKSLRKRNQQLKDDLQAIKAFTPDLRRHWLDSVSESAGLNNPVK